jgi:sugar/nucleoside kinase (ribokinase family)
MRFRLLAEARVVFLELARKCDILIPNLAEAEIMTGLHERESMLDALIHSTTPSRLEGRRQGAWYADSGTRFLLVSPVPEIDPVGAGDAFCASSFGLLDGPPLGTPSRGAALARSASLHSVITGVARPDWAPSVHGRSSVPGR